MHDELLNVRRLVIGGAVLAIKGVIQQGFSDFETYKDISELMEQSQKILDREWSATEAERVENETNYIPITTNKL